MSSADAGFRDFESEEELIQYLVEKTDDIDAIHLAVPIDLWVVGPSGEQSVLCDCCALLKTVDGSGIQLIPKHLELLLNHSAIRRSSIPIKLIPQIPDAASS